MTTLARHLHGLKDDGNTLTVLRVKRKRDQEPLEALLIQQQQNQRQRRVAKTRRIMGAADGGRQTGGSAVSGGIMRSNGDADDDDESDGGPLLFSLGETISEADFGNAQKRAALQERLATMHRAATPTISATTMTDDDAMMMETDDTVNNTSVSSGESQHQQQQPFSSTADTGTGGPGGRGRTRGGSTQLCVIGGRQVQLLGDDPRTTATGAADSMSALMNYGIPQVCAASEVRRGAHRRIKMFDAITEHDVETLRLAECKERRQQRMQGAMAWPPPKLASAESAEDADAVGQLVPMVRDRLSLAPQAAAEYVYDLYYVQSKQPVAAAAAMAQRSVAAVLWVDDINELLDGVGSGSDDGFDEDDDSNAEDYYANDYPDDPDSGSDDGYYGFYDSSDERRGMRADLSDAEDDYANEGW
ncbi:hypothetical protein LPJ72_001284 [Coemansia sp. Benny D160-2]|nr:hypothetical protein LPJ72_001284 [Coemansia sp. Benny D160-2]